MSDVAVPDQVRSPDGSTYDRSDDPHAENRAALSPCPSCGVNAHEGPEADHWVQFPHCWSCGYRPGGPAPAPSATAASLKPGDLKQLASSLADEIRSQLGLQPGERIVGADEQQRAEALVRRAPEEQREG